MENGENKWYNTVKYGATYMNKGEKINMAKNDVVLIDGILDDYRMGKDIGEKFEYFSIEQILKDYDLSEEELETGIVDEGNDGGIDGIYYFLNDRLIYEDNANDSISRFCRDFTIYIITCKHDDSFKQVPINNISTTLDEFFDLTIEDDNLKSKYSDKIIKKRSLLIKILKKIAPYMEHFEIKILYASRGSMNELAENVIAKANYLEDKVEKNFSKCNVKCEFVGASELLSLYRKKKQLISTIKCSEIITCSNSYIAICNLKDYYNFIKDEDNKLKRYYLDSNVRAYMGDNRVNKDIFNTLNDKKSPEFWFLNNGITILAEKVSLVGKEMHIENVQIVNGLQTTETIFNFYIQNKNQLDLENRNVLLKVIVSDDMNIRDNIIKSTNNQTGVELYALKATDKIQRDIEEIMLKNDLYYERRTNYYSNQGIEKEKIFSPLYLAYGYVTLIMKLPYRAVKLKSKFMNRPQQYQLVFSEDIPIQIWPVIAKILRKVDKVIEANRSKLYDNISTHNLLKYMRNIVSFLAISIIFGKFNFSAKELIDINIEDLTEELIINVFEQVKKLEKEYRCMRKKKVVMMVCEKYAENNGIKDFEKISKRPDELLEREEYKLTEEFIQDVKNNLPKQPWAVGTHSKIAKKLNVYTPKVSQAIRELIQRGDIYLQKNGILYDKNGNIVKVEKNK